MAQLTAVIQRQSYGRVLPRVDYLSYNATASQIGCVGSGPDDERQLIYGLNQAIAAGINVASYHHLIFMSDLSNVNDCWMNGSHGGIPGPTNPLTLSGLVKPDTGFISAGYGMNAFFSQGLLTHEFLHGYGAHFESHQGVMTCPSGVSPSLDNCSRSDWAAQGMYALGAGGYADNAALDGSSIVTEMNESAAYKWPWGWIGPSSVATPSPCGSRMSVLPIEASFNPAIGSYYYALTLPNETGWVTVEYRKLARIGPNYSNRPGVYANYFGNEAVPQPAVLNLQTDPANWQGTAPLSIGAAYQLGDSWIVVNSIGPDASGIERADITAWANSSLCVR